LQIPQTFVSPNRVSDEKYFMLWLSKSSSPIRLQDLQRRHGVEYSQQISRLNKGLWAFLFLCPKAFDKLPFHAQASLTPQGPVLAAKNDTMHNDQA